jgi:NADH-quinone oxidoreductase subunit E
LLFYVQSIDGYVTDSGMRTVAEILGLTPAQVLASASFYTMLKKKPQGEYLVSVCRNIACTHLGGREVLIELEQHLGIGAGETTADGKFSLEAAECLATCDGAPSMQINYEDFYKVDGNSAREILDRIARGEQVTSVRGETVKTAKEISRETAVAGTRHPVGDMEPMRTIGGETPRSDTAPGTRPKVTGQG